MRLWTRAPYILIVSSIVRQKGRPGGALHRIASRRAPNRAVKIRHSERKNKAPLSENELVGVASGGKRLPELPGCGRVERTRQRARLRTGLGEGPGPGNRRVRNPPRECAAGSASHAVRGGDEALVLDRPGPQQRPPRVAPRRRATKRSRGWRRQSPRQRRARRGSAGHRRRAAESARPGSGPRPRRSPGKVAARLAAGREEVTLVVMGRPSRRLDEIHAVAETLRRGHGDAAGDGAAAPCGPAAHGAEDRTALRRFGHGGRIRAEPRGEHLGQQRHIGPRGGYAVSGAREVPGRAAPTARGSV